MHLCAVCGYFSWDRGMINSVEGGDIWHRSIQARYTERHVFLHYEVLSSGQQIMMKINNRGDFH